MEDKGWGSAFNECIAEILWGNSVWCFNLFSFHLHAALSLGKRGSGRCCIFRRLLKAPR